MKARFYLAMAAAALLMTNCSQDEPMAQSQGGTNTLTATIEGASRSAVTDGGVFSWTSGDKISVYNGEGFTEFTLSSGNTFTGEPITPSGVAVYPAGTHQYDGTTTKINMPATYTYGSTNAPMLAEIGSGNNLQFKHLGGIMRFVVKGVPSSATLFTFTANSGITGDFEVTTDGENKKISATTVTENNKTVTINFTSADIKDVMTFYIPLPTGTYGGYTVSVGGKSHTTATTVENVINRGTLMLMPTFTYPESGNELVKGEDNMVVLNGNENVSLPVANGEKVTVAIADDAEATLNLALPAGTTDGTVNISDGSAENTGSQTTSDGTLNVVAANVSTLNIDAPTLTVKLASGEYDKVEALTAQQTLIIGEGVTIGELVLKGGNLKLEGDLTLTKPLEVKQDLELDLGGYTLTTAEALQEGSSSAAVIVYSGEVTVKNGTIATSGASSHKNMGALWVRGEEGNAQVTIEDGVTLKGNNWKETAEGQTDCMATVYVSNPNGYVTINGGEFYCVQQAQVAGQNQILNYKNDFETQHITVKGGKFHGMNPAKGNGVEVSYLAENAIVAETAEGTFEVLSATDGTITLSSDMTIYSPIEIKKGTFTLDLGSKTLTTAETLEDGSSAAVIVYGGTVTVQNGTIATSGTSGHKNMGALWVRGTEDAQVTIEEGVILKGNNWNEIAEGQTDCMATVYVSNANGSVTINGGEFYCVQQTQVDGQNQILNYKNDFTTQHITVMGGKFYRMDPAKGNGVEVSYLADGYSSTESEEDGVMVYTVAASTTGE